MGLFAEIFGVTKKKRCTECGCILYSDSESDICECCIDDMTEEVLSEC